MRGMFSGCRNLEKLNLFNFFNNNKEINTEDMFSGCESLKELNLINFNNKNWALGMFHSCPNDLVTKIKKQYKNFPSNAFDHIEEEEIYQRKSDDEFCSII